MLDCQPLLVSFYERTRDEIMLRIRLRDQYMIWFATLSSIAVGLHVKDGAWWGLVTGVPPLGLLAGLMYAHADITLGTLAHWLRTTYAQTVLEFKTQHDINHGIEFWDNSHAYAGYATRLAFSLRYFCASAIVVVFGAAACVLTYNPLHTEFPSSWIAWLALEVALSGLGAWGPLWALAERRKLATNEAA